MNIHSQGVEMQKIINKILFGSVFCLFFSWFAIFSASTEKENINWKTGVILISFAFSICFILSLLKNRITNPKFFHFSIFIGCLPNVLMLFDPSLRMKGYITDLGFEKGYFPIGINIFLIVISLTIQVLHLQEKLSKSTNENVKSGRLNLATGKWDLKSPILFVSKGIQNRQDKIIHLLAGLSPIVTAITFIVARSIEGQTQVNLLANCIFIMGLGYFFDYASHLAIALQIGRWQS
jgi:hypothetical protein